MGRLVARRIVVRHLATMARLGIGYDLLTHESDILGLDFFSVAFELLKATGAVTLEASGKNAGCWVMPLEGTPEFAGLEDPDKVIVRSDGTVTYVGKDIAYQLWKFGLLGKDFAYRYWKEAGLWVTGREGADDHPAFGHGANVINVIDARQSYLQKIVRAGLSALGHHEAAARSVHFAYEMVTLSPATAQALGYLAPEGEEGRSMEMSGRKGIGVKADDLLDRLEEKAREEIASRNRELGKEELARLAKEIAVAAVRFFMVKTGTTRVIAFDLDEALNFEGESGPYLQYSLVRASNIERKLAAAGDAERRLRSGDRRAPRRALERRPLGSRACRRAGRGDRRAGDLVARALAHRAPGARARPALQHRLPPPSGAARRGCRPAHAAPRRLPQLRQGGRRALRAPGNPRTREDVVGFSRQAGGSARPARPGVPLARCCAPQTAQVQHELHLAVDRLQGEAGLADELDAAVEQHQRADDREGRGQERLDRQKRAQADQHRRGDEQTERDVEAGHGALHQPAALGPDLELVLDLAPLLLGERRFGRAVELFELAAQHARPVDDARQARSGREHQSAGGRDEHRRRHHRREQRPCRRYGEVHGLDPTRARPSS